jgi:hypothetical protein
MWKSKVDFVILKVITGWEVLRWELLQMRHPKTQRVGNGYSKGV